ncbi:MAG: FecR domain-containing protein [Bacteriovoracaceae bacterium]
MKPITKLITFFVVILGILFVLSRNDAVTSRVPFLKNIFRKFKSTKPEIVVAKQEATMLLVKGDVTVNNLPTKTGEIIKSGSIIETGDDGFAIISFGQKYLCKVRIVENSKVNLTEIMEAHAESKTENSIFELEVGSVITEMMNTTEEPAKVSIKTRTATFGIRGTKFAVVADKDFSFLAVKQGTVVAENPVTFKTLAVEKGNTYSSDEAGNEKSGPNPEAINKFNWDVEEVENEKIDINEIKEIMNKIQVEATPTVNFEDKIKEVDTEIESFKKSTEFLIRDIDEEKKSIVGQVRQMEEEFPQFAADVQCLQSTPTKCKLNSEKFLVSRGYPQVHGSARLVASMVDTLKTHMKEQEDSLAQMKSNVQLWQMTVSKREEALKWAQEQRKQFPLKSTSPPPTEEILQRLRDPLLEKN